MLFVQETKLSSTPPVQDLKARFSAVSFISFPSTRFTGVVVVFNRSLLSDSYCHVDGDGGVSVLTFFLGSGDSGGGVVVKK